MCSIAIASWSLARPEAPLPIEILHLGCLIKVSGFNNINVHPCNYMLKSFIEVVSNVKLVKFSGAQYVMLIVTSIEPFFQNELVSSKGSSCGPCCRIVELLMLRASRVVTSAF